MSSDAAVYGFFFSLHAELVFKFPLTSAFLSRRYSKWFHKTNMTEKWLVTHRSEMFLHRDGKWSFLTVNIRWRKLNSSFKVGIVFVTFFRVPVERH